MLQMPARPARMIATPMLATTDYLGALPAPIAAATDINHIAENTIFPVHRVMVDSGLLAELFMLAAEQQSNLKAVLEIPLPGDKAPVVHTALKYIYAGYPQDDAKAVITFAHKYALNSLLEASEAFLVELAQADMEDHDDLNYSDDHYHLFTSNQAVLSWRELAEVYHLDSLLAHCELSMIRNRDEHLWRHPAMTSGKISHNCLLRMFRASQMLFQKQRVDIATFMAWRKEMP